MKSRKEGLIPFRQLDIKDEYFKFQVAEKSHSEGPSAYREGISIFESDDVKGWPTDRATVITLKKSNKRVIQFIQDEKTSDLWIRSGRSASSWNQERMAFRSWVEGKGYLTKHQSLTEYAKQSWVNDQGFLKSHQSLSGYAKENWVNSQGFLKSHQSLAGLLEKNKNLSDIGSKSAARSNLGLGTAATQKTSYFARPGDIKNSKISIKINGISKDFTLNQSDDKALEFRAISEFFENATASDQVKTKDSRGKLRVDHALSIYRDTSSAKGSLALFSGSNGGFFHFDKDGYFGIRAHPKSAIRDGIHDSNYNESQLYVYPDGRVKIPNLKGGEFIGADSDGNLIKKSAPSGGSSGPSKASTAEAKAGSNDSKFMTPKKTHEAFGEFGLGVIEKQGNKNFDHSSNYQGGIYKLGNGTTNGPGSNYYSLISGAGFQIAIRYSGNNNQEMWLRTGRSGVLSNSKDSWKRLAFADEIDNSGGSSGPTYSAGTDVNISSNNKINVESSSTGLKANSIVKLNAQKEARAEGGFFEESDKRVKKNIKELNIPLEKILQIPTVEFDKIESGKHSIGTIAQDLEKISPELISEGKSGIKSVNYAKLSVIALEAVKQLNSKIELQEERLNRIEKLLNHG